MKKTILLGFFLVLLSFSVLAGDWPQEGRSFFNDFRSSVSIGSDVLNSIQNTSVGSAGSIVYDIDGDGYGEIVTIESGLIRVRKYNSSLGIFNVLSEFDAQGIISTPYIFSDFSGNTYLVGYSTSNFYVYQVTGGSINFLTSASIPPVNYKSASGTFRASPPSPNCYTKGVSSYCVSILNNSGFAVANITGISMILTNYSDALLTDWPLSYKPALFDNPKGLVDPIEYAVLYCSSGGAYGVALVNLENGSIYKSNCTTTLRNPIGSPKTTTTDIYFGAVSGSGRYTEIDDLNSILLPRPSFPIVEDLGVTGYGYSGMLPFSNGNVIKIYQPSTIETYIKIYNSAGSVIANIKGPIDGATNIQQDTLSAGSDFIIYGNVYYSFIKNTTTRLWGSNIYSALYDSLSYSDSSGTKMLSWDNTGSVSSLHIFSEQAPPLTYSNVSVYIADNISKTLILGQPFQIIENLTGTLRYTLNSIGGFNSFITTQGAQTIDGHSLNVSVNIPGYIASNKAYFFPNGTTYLQVNLTPNSSQSSAVLQVAYYSLATGEILSGNNVQYSLNNLSGIVSSGVVDGAGFSINNLQPGNYTLVSTLVGYVVDTRNFYLTNAYSVLIGLAPISVVSTNQPQVIDSQFYIQVGTNSSGMTTYSNAYSPTQVCVNDTVFMDFLAVKSDNEHFYVRYTCDNSLVLPIIGSLTETTSDTTFIPVGIGPFGLNVVVNDTYKVRRLNGTIQCTYSSPGAQEIKVWGASSTFNNQLSDFPLLYAQGFARKAEFNVTSSCIGTTVKTDNKKNTVGKDVYTGYFDAMFGNLSDSSRLFLGVLLWLIMVCLFGFAGAKIGPTDPAKMFGFAGGAAGIAFAIIFSAVIHLLPGYFSFILALFASAGIGIAVISGMQGGG